MTQPDGGPVRTGPARPAGLVVLVGLVAGEAVLLLAVAGAGVLQTVTGAVSDVVSGVVVAVLPAAVGGFLLACARGLWRGGWWARAPVVTWQLLQLAVGVSVLTGDGWRLAVPLLAVSAAVVMLVVSPPVTAVTRRREEPPVT